MRKGATRLFKRTVVKWPFDVDEEELVTVDCDDSSWSVAGHPGKVFYYDAEEDPAIIENCDRVNMTHIDDSDGAVIDA
ncbi:MAG: hypothetical protein AUJ92_06575 [Armatimonadetes bacterium CG2_30_59_28]|nr:hypothetical protein [Armatimonadota bacterium]OIO96174.1 MAG: hypothetical protein AUJ92_06575 [Armatimonadetes bacterium CG2_30_59_28]PIU62181.1 MAG: hypothetical protein COS85_19320 [Armatimonadetes bacterium CG07_land_8_20_14_0_80_59_28]PIY38871.1 MAG: hypothetical protein COZ05_20070 [Armatimonadetes bacterium CG_4_10_14_3_um_filter_59_10]